MIAWLRLWIGTTLAATGLMAVVMKVSTMNVPGALESVFRVARAPGERLMIAFGCGTRGDCFSLPWPLIYCLVSGMFWATVITVAAWALRGIRGK